MPAAGLPAPLAGARQHETPPGGQLARAVVSTPLGCLLLVAGQTGLRQIAFARPASAMGLSLPVCHPLLREAAAQLTAYSACRWKKAAPPFSVRSGRPCGAFPTDGHAAMQTLPAP